MHVDLGSTWTPYSGDIGLVQQTGFAIYDHPIDYPEGFVVRRWWVISGNPEPVFDVVPRFTKTIESAREWIPQGFTRLPRMQGDDLSIFETWI